MPGRLVCRDALYIPAVGSPAWTRGCAPHHMRTALGSRAWRGGGAAQRAHVRAVGANCRVFAPPPPVSSVKARLGSSSCALAHLRAHLLICLRTCAGPIKKLRIVTDKEGKPKGYAFIEYEVRRSCRTNTKHTAYHARAHDSTHARKHAQARKRTNAHFCTVNRRVPLPSHYHPITKHSQPSGTGAA